uniref:Uncharacterized protein n=1 Tax=Wuchereria bancrofti TaxID=6293 RepID=A0AAF5Q7F8_WUCBA
MLYIKQITLGIVRKVIESARIAIITTTIIAITTDATAGAAITIITSSVFAFAVKQFINLIFNRESEFQDAMNQMQRITTVEEQRKLATLKLQQIFKITNIFPNIHNKKNIYGVNESTTMELLLLHKIPVSPVVPLYET